ncbi:MAG: glycosyltransferase [Syntrophorhabdaceae bacterium]|nr:glycosyltransferase [Syntrophorhabdaceae bacterium]
MNPLFSVVIPTYNHGHFIGRCLSSVLSQSFTDWEAIVVNNFSEDNTIEVVEGFKDERIRLVNFSNEGIIAASRNEGIRLARGEFVAFLDSDDWWYTGKLERVRADAANADVIYHDLDIHSVKGKKETAGDWRRQLTPPVFVDLMVNWNTLPNSGVVVRKAILDQVGGLTEDRVLNTFEDAELWLKISRVTERFVYVREKLGAYWVGEANLSTFNERHINCVQYIFDKYLDMLDEKDRRKAAAQMAYITGRIRQKTGSAGQALKLFLTSARSGNRTVRLKSLVLVPVCCLEAILPFLFRKGAK